MMRWPILPLDGLTEADRSRVGGKAMALSRLHAAGFPTLPGLVLPSECYRRYVDETGMNSRILFELERKAFDDMRWEEIWDAALRIRHLFTRTPLPDDLSRSVADAVRARFGEQPLVIRSSAPEEDAAETSFAGLHESSVNVRGEEAICRQIRAVWASLWSDRALLYRRELGLNVESSTMAVLIQPLLVGDVSGVLFTQSPNDASSMTLEAVPWLNQGLVDGTVEPDRWTVRRDDGRIAEFAAGSRDGIVVPQEQGTAMRDGVPEPESGLLSDGGVARLYELATRVESVFGPARDIEWTRSGDVLYVLQVRAITTAASEDPTDKRSWYLSLHRSFDNLKRLRRRIEDEWLPAMDADAQRLGAVDLSALSDEQLADALATRQKAVKHWTDVYWEHFIP